MRGAIALAVVLGATGCASHVAGGAQSPPTEGTLPSSPPPSPGPAPSSSVAVEPSPPSVEPPGAPLKLLLGGDVELARATGQRLLRDPSYDPFATLRSQLASADVRFVNLEGPLSDQHGETMSPRNPLIFTGPPSGAAALARAGINLVSTANNHAWDYGRDALLQTIDGLDHAGVAHAGTGPTLDAAFAPALVQARGRRVGLVAITAVFNFGPLESSPASGYLAGADPAAVRASVASARAQGADFVVVSVHVGDEYVDEPLLRTRTLMHALVDAGADLVVGHHPHVVQGVEWYAGKPIFYSLGNALMQMHSAHEWTGFGLFARVTLSRDAPPKVEACPHRILGLAAIPLAQDPQAAPLQRYFFAHLRTLQQLVGATAARIDPPGADGCAQLEPR